MAEGILTLTVLLGLLMASINLGWWQDTSYRLLGNTIHSAFVTSKGEKVKISKYSEVQARHGISSIQFEIEHSHAPSDRIRVISHQLGIPYDRLKVSQSANFKGTKDIPSFNIRRNSFLDIQAGYAHSDSDVNSKISRSQLIWRQAYVVSKPIAQTIGLATAPVDRPWKRSNLDADWFSKWQGAVPEKYLKKYKP